MQKQGIWLRNVGAAAILVTQGRHLLLDAEARGLVTSWWRHCGGQAPPRDWLCSELRKRLKRPPSYRELTRTANLLEQVACLLNSNQTEMHPVLHRDPHQPYHLTRLDVRLTGSQPPAIDDWLDSLAQSFSYRFVFRIDVDAINVRDGVTCLAGAVNWFARQGKLFLPHCLVHVRAHSASESAAITRCFQEIDLQDVLTSLVISVKRDIKEIEVGAFWAGKSLCVLPALEVTSDNATESCQIVAEFDDRPLLLVDGDPPALPWQYQQIAAVADPVKQPVFFLDDCRTQLFLWNMHECPGGRTVLAVDDSGGLFPCLPMLRGQQWCLGNIQTETHTYWSQVEDLKTRWRQARSTKCAKCLTEGWCSYCPAHEKEDAEAICAMKAAVWEQLT